MSRVNNGSPSNLKGSQPNAMAALQPYVFIHKWKKIIKRTRYRSIVGWFGSHNFSWYSFFYWFWFFTHFCPHSKIGVVNLWKKKNPKFKWLSR